MPNTSEGDLKQAAKRNPSWMELWARSGGPPAAHLDPELLREAYNEAWNAGFAAGERAGYRQAAAEGGDEGCQFGI